MTEPFLAYWGKAGDDGACHRLPYHCLDVAACGGLARRNKHTLRCTCGNRAHADVNAASNLARLGETAVSSRGVVSRPDVGVA